MMMCTSGITIIISLAITVNYIAKLLFTSDKHSQETFTSQNTLYSSCMQVSSLLTGIPLVRYPESFTDLFRYEI